MSLAIRCPSKPFYSNDIFIFSENSFSGHTSSSESHAPSAGLFPQIRRLWSVLRSMAICSGSLLLVTMVTLMLYPATTSAVQSVNKQEESVWTGMSVLCFQSVRVFL